MFHHSRLEDAMFHNRAFRGEGFGRRSRHERPFQKGDLKYIILDLLKDKPRYGYEIILALEEQSHGFYKPSPGVVYPTLQMLEEMGYASSADQDGKKIYTITPEGLAFLKERSDQADEVRRHTRRHWSHENLGAFEEVIGELAKIGKLVGPRIHDVSLEKLKSISQILSTARREIQDIMDR